ncbi:heat shock protein [DnaK] [Thermoplasma volcanium GSS1]|uniref:Chaperone protein DnaK n=1 Tax=Thermoplasma volcanium (strain ATCC 51530 / DSM 4299 / JCM 9571 / NBRC 15438 / GSS1) TaxID=273116 RepID=DNAK_THEVO|nr:molecular chaperone DnaK [Thermoplasma volcanium]Q97BG8.1 RecName: Full=Chaperone protein DnaK; AltName: Full=HSP70; AltName: Full=Heat shock 70 kDa protein; AltName: Full=Heat shock protein 70 [Thermoplasma volcanium GSS1]BAB59629.1 heat shock protein [DnaK] [Thermoplasma volcanium GSS1]
MSKIIGIDLGTSNSAAAVVISGKPTVIPSSEGVSIGGKAFPSYVAFTKDGQMLVGEPARRQALLNPEGTIFAAKRKMGTDYKFKVFDKEFTPQQISAFILQKIKKDAEAFLGEPVNEAVITVPAYFNDNQRQATKDAGTIAGFDVKRIINEPTAAALAYGVDKSGKSEKILVFDLGGGTLDVTIIEISKRPNVQVLSTSGDTQLGGTDMDEAIVNYIADDFQKKEGIDLRKDRGAYIRLRDAAEKAKIELSTTLSSDIDLPYITVTSSGPKHIKMTLTRAKLEELISPIVERVKAPIDKALEGAKLKKTDITKLLFVGGPTRIPYVRKYVEDYLGIKAEGGVDPMEAVAIGAAIQGAVLKGEIKDIVLLDVTPLTLSVETLGGIATPIIPANTTIPVRKSQVFTTAEDMQTTVTIHVVQGERPLAKDNVSLGMFNLTGIAPAPRGIPQIEVTFDIDSNGILNVTAVDKATGKKQGITITASTKLSKDEIERMKKEAEQYAEQDRKMKEQIETLNNAESLAYSVEKTLNEAGDKVDKETKDRILSEVKDLRKAIEEKNMDNVKTLMEKISKDIQEVGTKMYQSASSTTQTGSGNQNSSKQENDKTVDAEYKEKS